jgi:hypothetical protein
MTAVSGCGNELTPGDAVHCSAEFEAAADALNLAALDASDAVVKATDDLLSQHDRICK